MEIAKYFSTSHIEEILKTYFDIIGRVKPLVGEMDLNFHVLSITGKEFIFKIPHASRTREEIEYQVKLINHLNEKANGIQVPTLVVNKDGFPITPLAGEEGGVHHAWMLTWLPGKLLVDFKPHSPELFSAIGLNLAKVTQSLESLQHPFAKREMKWDNSNPLWIRDQLHLFKEDEREILSYFLGLFEKIVLPLADQLPSGIIYNDANDYNILISQKGDSIFNVGLIDFGDSIFSWRINDLAINCAYLLLDKLEPLSVSVPTVQAFNQVLPLENSEIKSLFSLLAIRLCISVTHATINRELEPENEYLSVTEKPAWHLLKQLRDVSPGFAEATFRHACGKVPFEKYSNYKLQLEHLKVAPIVQVLAQESSPPFIDLSIGSKLLGNHENYSTSKRFSKIISQILSDLETHFAIGGYGEVRPFYTTDAYLFHGDNGPKWRSTHMGLDVWIAEGTDVFAPLDGKVFSFKNNKEHLDYGPTIILEHEIEKDFSIYTLYGHLSEESLEGLYVGKEIKKSEVIAKIGSPPVNGDWPPHLHFQIMLDMLGMEGNFPGVSYAEEWPIFKTICPDPCAFLGINNPTKNRTSSTEETLSRRRNKLGKSLSVSYQKPLQILRGKGQYLFDETGRRYLDTVNNVAHVGHEHPRVVKAGQAQMAVLNTNSRYLHDNILEYAEALLKTFPPELCVCHFVNSGSEANELAMRMAKIKSGGTDMLAVEVGYHGNTAGTIDVSSYKFNGKGGQGKPDFTHLAPLPDSFRGKHRGEKTGAQYAYYISTMIQQLQAAGKKPAGFIHESILSCGGQIELPENYLKLAYKSVRDAGGVCIADEVQVGFGRTGKHFWGFELQGVVRDIVTMGKPIGNGHPLAAVVCTREVADAFANGMEFFNTFGGNPVSCAIGHEVLKVIKEEGLQENALEVGNYLRSSLIDLQKDYPIIGDVRGPGFFQGFELISDYTTMTPADKQANYLANRMKTLGVLMSVDGPDHNILKIKPPMVFDKSNVDMMIHYLRKVFGEERMKF